MRHDDSHDLSTSLPRQLRYYMTAAAPCPYVAGQVERKAFTHLAVRGRDGLHSDLSHAGFRRSQTVAYRPACPSCRACRSVRIDVARFTEGRRWRRVLSAHDEVIRYPIAPQATRQQYALFSHYLRSRHDGDGMSDMGFADYAAMVETSPVRTLVLEYRERGRLVGACITDVLRDGVSLVYSFFDPERPGGGTGNFIILDHVRLARELKLPFVYLGYWIEGSPKMAYKQAFRPLQVLDGAEWRALED